MVEAANLCVEHKALARIIIGNDAPSGTGVIPLGGLRVIAHLASLSAIKPEEALCMATGNTARIHKLPRGIIAEGLDADLVIMDAPMGSAGEDTLAAGSIHGFGGRRNRGGQEPQYAAAGEEAGGNMKSEVGMRKWEKGKEHSA